MDGQQEVLCVMKSYIQPFERRLALMELESLAGAPPKPEPDQPTEPVRYRVRSRRPVTVLSERLIYWETVSRRPKAEVRFTRQVRRESTVSLVRNGIAPSQLQALLPFASQEPPRVNRRVLRYGPHGAHEYRGKFFPQLVRALLNVAGIDPGEIVLDPMCGSGTAPVEAVLHGCESIGVDLNPLSVLMSRAKCNILTVRAEVLAAEYQSLKQDVLQTRNGKTELKWFLRLPESDQRYLRAWFSPHVIADLDSIAIRVNRTEDSQCRDFFRLCLSNILRRVSWQKDDDLRVRKEVRADIDVDAVAEFVSELGRTVRTVLAFLYEEGPKNRTATILELDSRELAVADGPLARLRGKVAAIVTSPPYATALPYLDTDRLSLIYLGLLSRPEHRKRDYEMIGNREVTEKRRLAFWAHYRERHAILTKAVSEVIDRIDRLNKSAKVGFRRRNLPALLSRYFFDMRQVFENMAVLLKPGAPAYVVIGNNHTIAGGQRVDIETDRLLGALGKSAGLSLEDSIPMEMLLSRDIFKKNAVASETILCFRAK